MDDVLLIPLNSDLAEMDNIFTLNSSAEFIWASFDGETSIGSIAEEMAAKYDVNIETAISDISLLIEDLLAANLVDECGASYHG